jgi:hypothetical protein
LTPLKLYDWVKGTPAPAEFEGEVLAMIRAFRPAIGPVRGA